MATSPEEGLEKSATLLIALGEDHAAEVLKHLGPREVQKLGHAMALLKSVPRTKVEGILSEFHQIAEEQSAVHVDTGTHGGGVVDDEHPQIIATILVHLEHDHASEILNHFTERLRNDVVLRIATLEGIQPAALKELNEAMMRILAGSSSVKRTAMGGVRTVAEILNFIGTNNETSVVDAIREYDPDLAQKILDEMFVFENLLEIDDRSIQLILREVQSDSLILALKGASPELREKIFKNMSQRAAEMLREDLESKGPVRLSEVEAEQKALLKVVRRLSDEGVISRGGGGDDEFV